MNIRHGLLCCHLTLSAQVETFDFCQKWGWHWGGVKGVRRPSVRKWGTFHLFMNFDVNHLKKNLWVCQTRCSSSLSTDSPQQLLPTYPWWVVSCMSREVDKSASFCGYGTDSQKHGGSTSTYYQTVPGDREPSRTFSIFLVSLEALIKLSPEQDFPWTTRTSGLVSFLLWWYDTVTKWRRVYWGLQF